MLMMFKIHLKGMKKMSLLCRSCLRDLFGFLLRWIVAMVEDDETEQERAGHHRERREVVRVGRGDESLVFSMAKWVNGNLQVLTVRLGTSRRARTYLGR